MSYLGCACAADRVLDELEGDGVADDEIVDRRSFADVAAVKEHVPFISETDESVAATDEQLHDPATTDDSRSL